MGARISFGTVGFPNDIYDIWQDPTPNLVASHGAKQDWEFLDKLFVTHDIRDRLRPDQKTPTNHLYQA